jgi:hypothetical protein
MSPSRRYAHSSVMHSDCMYVFGGYDCNSTRCRDLNILDLKTLKWSELEFPLDQCPPGRYHHGCVLKDDNMYIYSGMGATRRYHSGNDCLKDLWVFSMTNGFWVEIETFGNFPNPRYGFQMFYYSKELMIYGGGDGNSEFKNCYFLNLETCEWRKLPNEEYPFGETPLLFPRGCLINNKVYYADDSYTLNSLKISQ